jgi:hypothetical protein
MSISNQQPTSKHERQGHFYILVIFISGKRFVVNALLIHGIGPRKSRIDRGIFSRERKIPKIATRLGFLSLSFP